MLYDTTPSPRFLDAQRNMRWNATGALAELVDNSFGPERGNADNVWLTWNHNKYSLRILDDGRGMEHVGRLVKLGSEPIVSASDIGKYGSGGTMALLWLAERVQIWTMRDGSIQQLKWDWNEIMAGDSFPKITNIWDAAHEGNSPRALFGLGHGTLIQIDISRSRRRIVAQNIRRDLSVKYLQAFSMGKRIYWQTGREKAISLQESLPALCQEIDKEIVLPGAPRELSAHLRVGIVENLSTTMKGFIGIHYGFRSIMKTTDPFRSREGGRDYDGSKLLGYVTLAPPWKDYLATQKDDIANDELKSALFDAIHLEIRPLLEQVRRADEQIILNDLARILTGTLEESFRPHIEPIQPGNVDKLWQSNPGKSGARRRGKAALTIRARSDEEMDGCLFRSMEIDKKIEVEMNRDHPYVGAMLKNKEKSPEGIYTAVLREVADTIARKDHLIRTIFNREHDVLDRIESIGPEFSAPLIARNLIDRIPVLEASPPA